VVVSVAEFRINISNLSEGIHEHVFEAEPSKISLDERFKSMVKVWVRLDKSLHQILLQAKIWVEGTFICDRCLDDFIWQMDQKYSMIYLQGDRSTVDVEKEEEIHVLSADTNYIDLDEDVRQYILLAIPQKLLCHEDCMGICPICGVNKNSEKCICDTQVTDSRWDALKRLSHN
jgi:uncharacterized protein